MFQQTHGSSVKIMTSRLGAKTRDNLGISHVLERSGLVMLATVQKVHIMANDDDDNGELVHSLDVRISNSAIRCNKNII